MTKREKLTRKWKLMKDRYQSAGKGNRDVAFGALKETATELLRAEVKAGNGR